MRTPGDKDMADQLPTNPYPCYCWVFNRYIELGTTDTSRLQRGNEFRDKKTAAPLLDVTVKGIEKMIEERRVAAIHVGGRLRVHVPTSTLLLLHRLKWEWEELNCTKCP